MKSKDNFGVLPFIEAFRKSPVPAAIIGLNDGLFVDANESFLKLYGFERDKVVGHTSAELNIYLDPKERDMLFRILRERGAVTNHELMGRGKMGTPITLLFSANVIRVQDRDLIIAFAMDISARKETEKKLKDSEAMFARAQEMAHVGYWAGYSPPGDVYWSDETYRIFGFSPREREITVPFFYDRILPEDRRLVENTINEAIKTQTAFENVFRIVRPDGSIRWVHGKGEVSSSEDTDLLRVFGTILDITERKMIEQELRASRDLFESRVEERTEELQKAYNQLLSEIKQRHQVEDRLAQKQKMEAIGRLAGGIAHDFNNMLSVIIGNIELAMDDIEGPARQYLKNILNASERSRDLVRQILTFTRKSEAQRKPLHLVPLLDETISLLKGSLPSTIQIRSIIRTRSDMILANASQIQQILMNLATNAAHAMENGGILTISLEKIVVRNGDHFPDPDLKPGHYLKLTVSDTGAGIPEQIRSQIFEPFFTTKEPGSGTGMGLAVVFGIVKGNEGTITVESKPGKGTAFRIFLPLAGDIPEDERISPGNLPTGSERILVVDDEPSVVAITSQSLRRLGYKVTTAKSGTEGWKKFEAHPRAYDLVITDHVMPEMTGMRLAEKMLTVRSDLPVILTTGYSEMVSAEKAKEHGIRDFLMKPVMRSDLARTVRRLLDK